LILSPKWCCVGLAWICHFVVLDSHPKAMGQIYSSHSLALLYIIEGLIHSWGFKKECLVEKGLQKTILDFHNV
jgi:hypothetical protein